MNKLWQRRKRKGRQAGGKTIPWKGGTLATLAIAETENPQLTASTTPNSTKGPGMHWEGAGLGGRDVWPPHWRKAAEESRKLSSRDGGA